MAVTYTFRCVNGHEQEVKAPMRDGPPAEVYCDDCLEQMTRVYNFQRETVFNSDGFHATDYKHGYDMKDKLNRDWSRLTGERPPEPDQNARFGKNKEGTTNFGQ